MNVVEEVKAVISEAGLLRAPAAIVVAVSGGADSMALLYSLHRLALTHELELIAAHVNHGFRPEESAAEAELVRGYCEQHHILFEMIELDMPRYLQQAGGNSQAESRRRRYQFFHHIAQQYGAAAIALAHHADDQAETVLMHVLRGTGLSGLTGMSFKRKEKNVELIRPLLRMRKNELLLLCQQYNIPYLEDSSNQSRHYQRNELRLDIIPQLERYNPRLVSSLARLAEIASEEDAWLQQQTEQRFSAIVTKMDNSLMMSCTALNAEPVALQRRLIKLILSYLSQDEELISFEAIERIRAIAIDPVKSVCRLDVGAGLICVREYERLRFVHIKHYQALNFSIAPLTIHSEQLPCELQYGDWLIQASIISNRQQPQLRSKYEAVFDIEALAMPLTIRSRETGDRMQVLGLNGTKKVQDMFVDAKIAASERDIYPIVEDGKGQLIWLPGIRRSSYGLVSELTQRMLHIQCIRRELAP
ncbi:tRNA(Ile)-lysidine synthase [Paenibacillus montaniterrae]|uniref:tRNA(Ile)-lysidine synthase n=1 Tax=Paenibacillus montaniterrae TaxID=429341 RepID=A0A919YUZ6_9BACL|nr:tRNA lysidine(34) synthetase TilS [Paenibacillus montaniterrae]GIP19617.1 tRNA(Ile)-lysidine synthase [Paenibacillus montaniterrae]